MTNIIKEIPDSCSNCGGDLIDGSWQCRNCGETLCLDCICLCSIETVDKQVEEEFEIEDDSNKVTNFEQKDKIIEKNKKEDVIVDGDDEWLEIKEILLKKEESKE